MHFPDDIIFHILDHLVAAHEFEALRRCFVLDRAWYRVAHLYPARYRRHPLFFAHMVTAVPHFRRFLNARTLRLVAHANLHHVLTRAAIDPGTPTSTLCRHFFVFVPNPRLNSLTLAPATASRLNRIVTQITVADLIPTCDALCPSLDQPNFHHLVQIYHRYFRPTRDPFLLLIWIFIITNISDDHEFLQIYPFNLDR
jgi:hypothetical protein